MTATPEPQDEAPPHQVDIPIWVLGGRLEEIANTIQEFAALRFDARAPVGPDGDIVDAVGAGVNFLGEKLAASFHEIERRVADRTAELTLATQELARRALSDELTGLPNRTRFDGVFLDLVYLGRLIRPGGVLFLDDYQLPAVQRAASFFVKNLGWTMEEVSPSDELHQWAVLRSLELPDERPFDFYIDF